MAEQAQVFMLVAGELSGDILGAGLINALKKTYPQAQFIGIGGPLMLAEGLTSLAPIDALSIMGLVEVIRHLPELLRIKKRLMKAAQHHKITAYIGIDAPDFNLRVAKPLKRQGITTFQYVSPSIWVWREKRVFTIKKAIDRVLCLFPFELEPYRKHSVDAVCVGHRLGDEIALVSNPLAARASLKLKVNGRYLAILPGSRQGEVQRLLPIFLATAQQLSLRDPQLNFIIPAATEKIARVINIHLTQCGPTFISQVHVVTGQSRLAMEAAEAVLLASGTAALEAMLLKKPMVVAYKFNALTAWLAKRIVKTKYFSLPNILSGHPLVPEIFQQAVRVEVLVPLLEQALTKTRNDALQPEFLRLHQSLRLNADQAAAQAVIEKLVS